MIKKVIVAYAFIYDEAEETGLIIEAGDILSVNEAVIPARGNQALFLTFKGLVEN